MGIAALRDRIADKARRCGDLKPLSEPVRKLLWEGNKQNKSKGLDPDGNKYAKLKPSTIKRKPRLNNTPFMTHPPTSAIVTGYVVDVRAGVGRLTFTGSWPGLAWPEWHIKATKNRAARNPYGFRRIDLLDIHDMLKAYVATDPKKVKSWWRFW